MRIDSITVDGITRYSTSQTLNISALPEGIWKIHAANGAGKSTLLECIHYALFGSMVSRPDLLQDAINRGRSEGKIELRFNNGKEYRSIIQVKRGKTPEAFLYENGVPVVNGKISELEKYVQAHIIPKEIFLSCIFRSQNNAGDFVALKRADRKELMIRLLNLRILQQIAEQAKDEKKVIEPFVTTAKSQIESLEQKIKDVDPQALEAGIAEIEGKDIPELAARIQTEQEKLTGLQSSLSNAANTNKLYEAQEKRVEEAKGALSKLWWELTTEEKKKAETEEQMKLLPSAEVLKAAEQNILTLKKAIEACGKILFDAGDERDTIMQAINEGEKKKAAIESEIRVLKSQLQNAQDAAAILINGVPCGEDLQKNCKFASNAVLSKGQIKELTDAIEHKTVEFEAIVIDRSQVNTIDTRTRVEHNKLTALKGELAEYEGVVRQASEVSVLAERVSNSEATILAFNTKIAEQENRVSELQAELEKLARVEVESLQQEVRSAENDIAFLQNGMNSLNQQLGNYKQWQVFLAQTHEELNKLRGTLGGQLDKVEQLTHVERAFGKEGIQAIEIDYAGPSVSQIANELLHKCYGPRFSIKFVTTKPKADGKGETEVFDVMVIDAEQERESRVESLSGGEKVYVSIAIQLAIAVYLNQKSGIHPQQIILDECLGALTEDNAAIAIQMLRLAKEMLGLRHLFFVAHLDALAQYADGIIHINDGKIEVVGQ